MSTFVMSGAGSVDLVWNICVLVLVVVLAIVCAGIEMIPRRNKERQQDIENGVCYDAPANELLPKSFRRRNISDIEK